MTLYLNQTQPLQVFDTLTEAVTLPQGYKRMLEYNLAIDLESIVGLPLSPKAERIAGQSKASVKRANHLPIFSTTDTFHVLNGGQKGDIYAGG